MPYTSEQLKAMGIYEEKPEPNGEFIDDGEGQNRITELDAGLRKRLSTVSGGKFNDPSKEDLSVISLMLAAELPPHDVCATFMQSPRGLDVQTRKPDPADYIRRTMIKALSDSGLEVTVTSTDDAITEVREPFKFEQIPDVTALAPRHIEEACTGLIIRRTITLWSGKDGVGKSYLTEALGAAIAAGDEFCGMSTRKMPVVIIDYQNAQEIVQWRLRKILNGSEAPPGFKIWGGWCEPAMRLPTFADADKDDSNDTGFDQLLALAEETKGLIIIDIFRDSHNEEEDSSTAMKPIMKKARMLVRAGATVILVHHTSRSEDSDGRGSTAIRAECETVILQSREKDDSVRLEIKKESTKGRTGSSIYIDADFAEGKFVARKHSPQSEEDENEIERATAILKENGPLSQNQFAQLLGDNRSQKLKFIARHVGKAWRITRGPRNSLVYETLGDTSTCSGQVQDETLDHARLVPATPGREQVREQVVDLSGTSQNKSKKTSRKSKKRK